MGFMGSSHRSIQHKCPSYSTPIFFTNFTSGVSFTLNVILDTSKSDFRPYVTIIITVPTGGFLAVKTMTCFQWLVHLTIKKKKG